MSSHSAKVFKIFCGFVSLVLSLECPGEHSLYCIINAGIVRSKERPGIMVTIAEEFPMRSNKFFNGNFQPFIRTHYRADGATKFSSVVDVFSDMVAFHAVSFPLVAYATSFSNSAMRSQFIGSMVVPSVQPLRTLALSSTRTANSAERRTALALVVPYATRWAFS